jgi:hypothetical protein
MSVRPLIPGERDSVSLAHALQHVLGDHAANQFGPAHPFVIWLGASIDDNGPDERLNAEAILGKLSQGIVIQGARRG